MYDRPVNTDRATDDAGSRSRYVDRPWTIPATTRTTRAARPPRASRSLSRTRSIEIDFDGAEARLVRVMHPLLTAMVIYNGGCRQRR